MDNHSKWLYALLHWCFIIPSSNLKEGYLYFHTFLTVKIAFFQTLLNPKLFCTDLNLSLSIPIFIHQIHYWIWWRNKEGMGTTHGRRARQRASTNWRTWSMSTWFYAGWNCQTEVEWAQQKSFCRLHLGWRQCWHENACKVSVVYFVNNFFVFSIGLDVLCFY